MSECTVRRRVRYVPVIPIWTDDIIALIKYSRDLGTVPLCRPQSAAARSYIERFP